MRHRTALLLALLGSAPLTGACSGLVAGPEVASTTPVPASRDSAWARVRRGLTAESFSTEVVDSIHGHLTGTRFNSPTAPMGTAQRCRMGLVLDVTGQGQSSEVKTTSRWIVAREMADKAPRVCEQERQDVLERVNQTLVPPPQ